MKIDDEEIRKAIQANMRSSRIEVGDFSSMHEGHAGAKSGGHYSLLLVSDEFEGKSMVQRHRMVMGILKDYFENGIHALTMDLRTPGEDDLKKGQ